MRCILLWPQVALKAHKASNTIRGFAMQEISLPLQVTTIVLATSGVDLLFYSMRILQGRGQSNIPITISSTLFCSFRSDSPRTKRGSNRCSDDWVQIRA